MYRCKLATKRKRKGNGQRLSGKCCTHVRKFDYKRSAVNVCKMVGYRWTNFVRLTCSLDGREYFGITLKELVDG